MLCLAVAVVAIAAGLGIGQKLYAPKPRTQPNMPAVIQQMRTVARLESLDVLLFKKISFSPDPHPTGSMLGDVLSWAKFTLHPPHGKAIVFAEAHLGVDMQKLDAKSVRKVGDTLYVRLPKVAVRVELRPGDTEIIDSSLDSKQTAQLFAVAKEAFSEQVNGDRQLINKAKSSAAMAIQGLLLQAGFRQVRFVDQLPAVERD